MALDLVTKSWYQYVSDDGNTYRVLLADYIATQMDGETPAKSIIGAVAAAQSLPRYAKKAHPRRALLRDETNHVDRLVIVCTPTAPIISVPQPAGANTLLLNSTKLGSTETYTYSKHFLTEYIGPAKP